MPNFKKRGNIDEVTNQAGQTYFQHKALKEALDDRRSEFFKAASSSFTEKNLARRTVEIPADQSADAEGYAERYNTGWRVVEVTEDGVLIEEDPDFLPYSHTYLFEEPREEIVRGKKTEVYGYVISRSIQTGSAMLDDERLIAVDPELYEEVTQWANYDLILKIEVFDSDIWHQLDEMGWPREPKPIEDLSAEQYARVQQFTYESPRTPKFLVRYATKKDIEE